MKCVKWLGQESLGPLWHPPPPRHFGSLRFHPGSASQALKGKAAPASKKVEMHSCLDLKEVYPHYHTCEHENHFEPEELSDLNTTKS